MKWIFVFSLLCFMVMYSCHNQQNGNHSQSTDEEKFSVLLDKRFERGLLTFGDTGAGKFRGENVYPFGRVADSPAWKIAEWFSRYKLKQADLIDSGQIAIFQDKGKSLSFEKKDSTVIVRMKIFGSEEYDHIRKGGEPWPHLLLEQDFKEEHPLDGIKNLTLKFEGRLIFSKMKMPAAAYDSGLHTAHFQLFFSIQDRNPESPGYRDFLWFGLSFYDNRYKEIPLYAAQDLGKEDATQKFIYELGTREYIDYSNLSGDWLELKMDLKPHMLKAFQEAKKNGFLKGSELQDMSIVNFNIGWEVTGTFDAGYEFKNLDIRMVNKK